MELDRVKQRMANKKNDPIMVNDKFYCKFDDFAEFIDFIRVVMENSEWEEMQLGNTKVVSSPINGPIELNDVINKYSLHGLEEDSVLESLIVKKGSLDSSTGMLLSVVSTSIKPTYHLISDTGLDSYILRAGANCPAVCRMPFSDKEVLINLCVDTFNESSIIALKRFDKIRATHSSLYSVLPQDRLINSLVEHIQTEYGDWEMPSASYSHSQTIANFRIISNGHKIFDHYNDLQNEKTKLVFSDPVPCLTFKTSDVASSSASVSVGFSSSSLSNPNLVIPIGQPLSLRHRGDNGIKDWKETLNGIFASFQIASKHLEDLSAIRIQYPMNVVLNLQKKFKIPTKAITHGITMFFDILSEEGTASDVFFVLQETICYMDLNDYSMIEIANAQEEIAKVVCGFSWEDYDTAETINILKVPVV